MPQVRIEHRIGVAAPAEVIWEVVSDLGRWPEWNPIYSNVEGRLQIGAPISMDIDPPGLKRMHVDAVIVDWVPEAQILWSTKLPGFVRSLRYIEIDKLSETGCILANGEIFEGFGVRFMSGKYRSAAFRSFEAMGEALKARAEAVWRERAPAPTSEP
jgi:hypothetical protein